MATRRQSASRVSSTRMPNGDLRTVLDCGNKSPRLVRLAVAASSLLPSPPTIVRVLEPTLWLNLTVILLYILTSTTDPDPDTAFPMWPYSFLFSPTPDMREEQAPRCEGWGVEHGVAESLAAGSLEA